MLDRCQYRNNTPLRTIDRRIIKVVISAIIPQRSCHNQNLQLLQHRAIDPN
ncbi:MAG: hypothetical protein LH613_11160 [Chamaesiphon sp.]|nr:hypothetical protein [Chamaesiphon sp.]